MAKLELKLLGGAEARVGSAPVTFPTRHCMLLLAYLALKPDLAQSRDALSALFWGEREDAQARSSLRQTLYRLRQTLDGCDCPVLEADHRTVRLSSTALSCDVTSLETALRGETAGLLTALDLYRGDLLADCGRTGPGFDNWLREERTRLRILVGEGFRRLASMLRDQRRFAEMEIAARKLIDLDEYDEEARRLLMIACNLQGRRNAALAAYAEFAALLSDQLGVSPEPETADLFRQIQEKKPAAAASSRTDKKEPPQTRLVERQPPVAAGAGAGAEQLSVPGEAVRREVTVLAINLAALAEGNEDGDPETSIGRMTPVLRDIAAIAGRFGGEPCQAVGDDLYVLFGATTAHEDHAVRACNAALAIADGLTAQTEAIAARIGLHCGEMIVRTLSQAQAFEGVAAGPPIARAQQLARSVRPGKIALSRTLRKRVEGFFDMVPASGRDGKEPARDGVQLLVSATGARSRLQALAERRFSDFTGRTAELAELQRALDRTMAGRGEITAVVGDAGIGKSRLLQEFFRTLPARELTLLKTGAASHDNETTYAPVGELVRDWLGVEADEQIEERLAEKLGAPGTSRQISDAPLRSILGLPVHDSEWEELSPPQRRARIIDAVRTILIHESRRKPTIIVFEDLHWIDQETQAVLDDLIDDLPGARLMLLVTYRPEYQHDWVGRSFFSLVRVHALPGEIALALIDSLLGADESLDRLKRLLLEQCGGVPLFIEESIRALADSDSLAGPAGNYRLVRPVEQLELAPTIRDVLAARIDRLSTSQKSLLQRASVIGTTVPLGLLRGICQCNDTELMETLAELRAAEFLYQTKWQPEEEYEFKHALTHEVAYRTLLKDSRRAMHAQLVEVIEGLDAVNTNDLVERLAYHAAQGEVWEKAVVYLGRAGENAVHLSAYQQARSFLTRAVEATDRLPKSEHSLRAAIDARLSLRPVLVAGEFDAARQYLDEAETLAAQMQDDVASGAINVHKSYVLSTHGMLEQAIEAAENGLAIAQRAGAEDLRKEALLALAQSCSLAARSARTISLLRPALGYWIDEHRHERFGHTGTRSIWCLGWIGGAYAQLGDFDTALEHTSTACAIAAETKRPVDLLFARHRHGETLLARGEIDQAVPHLQAAFDIAGATEAPIFRAWVAGDLGHANLLGGRVNDARMLLQESCKQARQLKLRQFESWSVVHLAAARRLTGEADAAVELSRAALKRAREIGDHMLEIAALRELATGLSACEPADDAAAQDCLTESIRLAKQRSLLPELAHSLDALGDLHRRAGRTAAAEREQAAADRIRLECSVAARPALAGS